jgi:hypothetical protein
VKAVDTGKSGLREDYRKIALLGKWAMAAEDMRMSKLSDSEIVDCVIDGDVNVFEELVRRYQDLVFKIVARRMPAGFTLFGDNNF